MWFSSFLHALHSIIKRCRFQWKGSEKDGGLRFVGSHFSVLSAVEGSAFFRLDEWGTAVLGYFMTGPPAPNSGQWSGISDQAKRPSQRPYGAHNVTGQAFPGLRYAPSGAIFASSLREERRRGEVRALPLIRPERSRRICVFHGGGMGHSGSWLFHDRATCPVSEKIVIVC
jgi:hypothetical protein